MADVYKYSEAAAWSTGTHAPVEIDTDDGRMYINRNGTREAINVDYSGELTVASSIVASQSGAVFYINNATGFITTLPAPFVGARYTFINKTANTSGNHTIVSASSANVIKGNQNSVAGDAGDFGTADDTISFVANQSIAGDKVELHSDGTSWFAYAISKVAAGVTFTQAS